VGLIAPTGKGRNRPALDIAAAEASVLLLPKLNAPIREKGNMTNI
jgi:hypothetical protein